MIGLSNLDNSFFSVESDDISLKDKDIAKDVRSLTITERMSGLPQGTIEFNDPDDYYSHVFRSFAKLKISWGFKKFLETPESLIGKSLNTDEITGGIVRRGLEVLTSNPTGSAGQDAIKIYRCNFTAFGFRGTSQAKTYEDGTKSDVVSQVMDDMKINPVKRYIDFDRGSEKVSPEHPVYQDESSFAFLVRMAVEWGCVFKIGWSDDGTSTGIFMDTRRVGDAGRVYPSWVGGAVGQSHVIGYKGEINNVKSYSWESNEGESGVGSNVVTRIVNGEIVMTRYVAEGETVVGYELNMARVQAALRGDLETATAKAAELLKAKDFESVKDFFDKKVTTTAPEGYGYRIKAEMIGNPLFSPPNRVKINNGFPSRIGGSNTTFYLYEVTHRIDMSGYNMSVEIWDAFSISPTGTVIL